MKIRKITKRHIGKCFKYYSGSGAHAFIYEYVYGADDTTYDSIGRFIKGDSGIFQCDVANAIPDEGYWEPISRLELAVAAPEMLKRISEIEDGTQDTRSM
jgi:hypothetical protein